MTTRAKYGITPWQAAAHMLALIPLASLVYATLTDNLTANPIQYITQKSGLAALTMLIASLAITPLRIVTQWSPLSKMRRLFGLYSFFYAAIHLLIFIAVDYGFAWGLIWQEISEKRYIIAGLTAFSILLALALTSSKAAMRRMGKKWTQLHKLVYLAAPIIILHFAWAVKGDLVQVSGEVFQPLLYGLVVLLLLAMRLPPIRKRLARIYQRYRPVRKVVTGKKTDTGTRAQLQPVEAQRSELPPAN